MVMLDRERYSDCDVRGNKRHREPCSTAAAGTGEVKRKVLVP